MQENHVILYIGNNYLNSAAMNFYSELDTSNKEIKPIDVNKSSISEIKKELGFATTVAVDDYLLNLQSINPIKYGFTDVTNWRGDDYYKHVVDAILATSCPKVFMAMHLDLHNACLSDQHIITNEQLSSEFQLLAWVFEHGVEDKAAIPKDKQDNWMNEYANPIKMFQKCRDLFKRRIDLPFSYKAIEINPVVSSHKLQIMVPGVRYRTREIALNSIISSKLDIQIMSSNETEALRLLHTANTRYLRSQFVHQTLINLRRRAWQKQLWQADFAWVDGSSYRYPVFKFIEVPASSTVMITDGHKGLEEYGFRNNFHFLFSEPEDLNQTVSQIVNERQEISKIKDNALKLIGRLHTSKARVAQFRDCLRAVKNDDLTIACFRQGEFRIT